MAFGKSAITFQASASNGAGSTLVGSTIDLTARQDDVVVMGKVTNGGTGPTVGCDFVVQVSDDATFTRFYECFRSTAALGNSSASAWAVVLPRGVMYARTLFTGNTGQAVTCEAYGMGVATWS